jgi:hypothetical protein
MGNGRQGPLVATELHGARNFFTNNSVYNYPQGLWIASNLTNLSYHMVVSNNTFVVSSYGALFFKESVPETPIHDVVIANNNFWITDAPKTPLLTSQKIGIGVISSLGATRNVIIANNNIKTNDSVAAVAIKAYAFGAGTSIQNITISSNQIEGFAINIVLGITGGGSFDEIVVDSNSILNVTPNSVAPVITIGIAYEGVNGNLALTNNYISSAMSGLYYGIYLAPGSTLQHLSMENNIFDAAVNNAIVDGVNVTGRRYGEQARSFAALPAQSTWVQGDYAYNLSAGQLGSPGSRYIITQWYRATTGTAHVLNTDWLECRSLTGN